MEDFPEPEHQTPSTTERYSRGRTKLLVMLAHILLVAAGYGYLFFGMRSDWLSVPVLLMLLAVAALPWWILQGDSNKIMLLGLRGLIPYIILFFMGVFGIARVFPAGNLMYATGLFVCGLVGYYMTMGYIDNLDPEDPLSLEE